MKISFEVSNPNYGLGMLLKTGEIETKIFATRILRPLISCARYGSGEGEGGGDEAAAGGKVGEVVDVELAVAAGLARGGGGRPMDVGDLQVHCSPC